MMKEQQEQCAMSLYYMAKVWGLAPFTVTNGHVCIGSSIQVVYPIILLILCILQLIGNLIEESRSTGYENQSGVSYISTILSMHLGNLAGGLFVITFVLKRRKIVEMINALLKIDSLLSSSGFHRDNEKYWKSRIIAVGSMSCITIVTFFGTNISHLHITGGLYDVWTSFLVLMGTWIILIQFHGIIVFVIALDLIEKRYQQLNDRFSNVCTNVDIVRTRGAWNIALEDTRARRTRINPRDDRKPLESLRKLEDLHDNLRDTTDNVLDIFGVPIVGSLAYYFLTMLAIFYFIYADSLTPFNADYQATILTNISSWMVVTLTELFAIAAVSSSLQKTVRNTTSSSIR